MLTIYWINRNTQFFRHWHNDMPCSYQCFFISKCDVFPSLHRSDRWTNSDHSDNCCDNNRTLLPVLLLLIIHPFLHILLYSYLPDEVSTLLPSVHCIQQRSLAEILLLVSSNRSILVPAAKAVTFRSLLLRTISSVWVPMEPVIQ